MRELKSLHEITSELERARREIRESGRESTVTALSYCALHYDKIESAYTYAAAGILWIYGLQEGFSCDYITRCLGVTEDGWVVIVTHADGVVNGWSFVREEVLFKAPQPQPHALGRRRPVEVEA